MVSFGSLDIKAKSRSGGVGSDSGISRVGKRTGLTVTEASGIVFIATKSLRASVEFQFVRAMLVRQNLPCYLIAGHGSVGCRYTKQRLASNIGP